MLPKSVRVAFPPSRLRDLRRRLDQVRWPDQIGEPWEYGTDRAYLRDLVAYWRRGFDWRRQVRRLNRLPHRYVEIEGQGIHFLHLRGRGPRPFPLLAIHGWPSSFTEMLDLIPLLTEACGARAESFDLVIPSLPGCGLSARPVAPGMNKTRMAHLFTRLMHDVLGYPRFGVRGGDIGSGVAALMGLDHPECVAGIHVSDVVRPWLGPGAPELSEAEKRYLQAEREWMRREGAYDHIQATKPQTLAYALNDSPVGLAAWIVEKFRAWSDCGGDLERRFSRDTLLTNITLYWLTGTINSANRLYFERDRFPRAMTAADFVRVPCAVTLWPADIDQPPREYAERIYNLERFTVMPRGGHFAALEEPALLAEDLRLFFRGLRG